MSNSSRDLTVRSALRAVLLSPFLGPTRMMFCYVYGDGGVHECRECRGQGMAIYPESVHGSSAIIIPKVFN